VANQVLFGFDTQSHGINGINSEGGHSAALK
jgi:hypothetical protein